MRLSILRKKKKLDPNSKKRGLAKWLEKSEGKKGVDVKTRPELDATLPCSSDSEESGRKPLAFVYSQSSSISVSSLSEAAPSPEKPDRRASVAVDVDDLPKRQSNVVDVDELIESLNKKADPFKNEPSRPSLPKKVREEISSFSWNGRISRPTACLSRVLQREICDHARQIIVHPLSMSSELQSEIKAHARKPRPLTPSLPQDLKEEIQRYERAPRRLAQEVLLDLIYHAKLRQIKKLPSALLNQIVSHRRPRLQRVVTAPRVAIAPKAEARFQGNCSVAPKRPIIAFAPPNVKRATKSKSIPEQDVAMEWSQKQRDFATLAEALSVTLKAPLTDDQKQRAVKLLINKYQERQQPQTRSVPAAVAPTKSAMKARPRVSPKLIATKSVVFEDLPRKQSIPPNRDTNVCSKADASSRSQEKSKQSLYAETAKHVVRGRLFPIILSAIASVRNQEY